MKRMSKPVVSISLGLALLVGAAASAQAAKHKIRWLLGHPNLDYFEAAAESFKSAVEKGSGGDIEVEIVTASDPWRETGGRIAPEIADKVAQGEAEMGHSFTNVLGKIDHRLWAFDAPYLFNGYLHMEGVIEGPLGPELLEGLRGQKIVGLAFTYSGGAQGVATTDREIRAPEDLKGRKVGVFGDDVDNAWLSSLGAEPVALKHQLNAVNQWTQDGKIDSVVVTWRRVRDANLAERYKYVSLMNSSYLVSVTYINEKFFDGLPEKHRKLIRETALAAARIERARTIELNEMTKSVFMAKGVVPVYLSDAGRAKFQAALRPVYERSIDGIVGKELIDRIRRTPDGPSLPSGLELVGR